jgi:hypothetical protein
VEQDVPVMSPIRRLVDYPDVEAAGAILSQAVANGLEKAADSLLRSRYRDICALIPLSAIGKNADVTALSCDFAV